MILMEKETTFPTDVETWKHFALILYAAKQRILSAERIRRSVDNVQRVHRSTGEVCSMFRRVVYAFHALARSAAG